MSNKMFVMLAYFLVNIVCFNLSLSVTNSNRFKPVTHVVFDLDGTLIDTESCYKDAANAVTSRYGKEFTWEHKTNLMGTNLVNNSDRIVKFFNLPLTGEEFVEEVMNALKVLIANDVQFMPGAERIVQYFHNNNITLGLCTAGSNDTHYTKVNHFGDFFKPGKYFDAVVLAGNDPEITHNKPNPEPYLVTFKRLPGNPKPENVLVFEDSLDGMKSAIAAGAQCVMIPDRRVDFGNATSDATLVIKSLNDFDPSLFSLPPFNRPSLNSSVSCNPVHWFTIIVIVLLYFVYNFYHLNTELNYWSP